MTLPSFSPALQQLPNRGDEDSDDVDAGEQCGLRHHGVHLHLLRKNAQEGWKVVQESEQLGRGSTFGAKEAIQKGKLGVGSGKRVVEGGEGNKIRVTITLIQRMEASQLQQQGVRKT